MSDAEHTWVKPSDPTVVGDYWVTRRCEDAGDGYGLGGPDIRVRYRWIPESQAWITGHYQGIRGRAAEMACLHSNNGWRIEGPATECPHPSVFIQQEMATRGWDRWELARRMGGDYRTNRLEIDLYFEVGPDKPNMRLGQTGEDMARAFGVPAEFLRNLETAWLKADRG